MMVSQSVSPVSSLATVARYLLFAFAWLFVVGAIIQVFLIGLQVFGAGTYLDDHTDYGHMIGFLAYVLPIFALIGRVGRRLVVHAVAVIVIYELQIVLAAAFDEPWIRALHSLNAFLVIGSAASLGGATLALIRARGRTGE